MEADQLHPVYTKHVVEFVAVANEYCKLIESAEQLTKKDFIFQNQRLLAYLYQKASVLPSVEPETDGGTEKLVTEADYEWIKSLAALKLGTHEEFIEVYEPIRQEHKDAIQVSLAEVFADIYQELKDFIFAYSNGIELIMNDALYECQVNYEQFWGPRLLAGLMALHNLVYGDDDLEEEDEGKAQKSHEDLDKIDTSDWLINQFFEQKPSANSEDEE